MATDLFKISDFYLRERGNRERYLWDYYVNRDVPVFKRRPISALKKDSHVNTHEDFMRDIIDLKTGYMGQKISITYNSENKDFIDEKLKEFTIDNNLRILNSDTIRKTSIAGISHRILYTEPGGKVKIMNIGPETGYVVYDYETDIFNPTAAYFFYATLNIEGEKEYHCDVYDNKKITYYKSMNKMGEQPDGFGGFRSELTAHGIVYKKMKSVVHNFNEVPVIPFINNDTWSGDCDKVIGRKEDAYNSGLMDVYDEILSDTAGEVKGMRLAFLKIFGRLYTGKDADGNPIDINQWMKQTSSMQFPVDDEGNRTGDAEFLEKNINDAIIENMLNRLRNSIYEKSGSVDIKSISDGNNQRVISIKAQLLRLENNCSTTESYMRAGMLKMMRVFSYYISNYFNRTIDVYGFQFDFERVFPTDVQTKAETTKIYVEAGVNLEDALRLSGHEDWKNIAENRQQTDKTI